MSNSEKNLSEIYDDIGLCYKVLGLEFSDPPQKVDHVYKTLVAENTKASHSPDPSVRQNAAAELAQLEELYSRITSSQIYKDYAREYEKYKRFKEEEAAAKHSKEKPQEQMQQPAFIKCPYCNRQLPFGTKVCNYCRHKILTPFEKFMEQIFTTKNMIILVVILILIIAGILFGGGYIKL